MPTCFIVACDHGFGHTRRSFLIANEIARSGWEVDFYADEQATEKFIDLFGKHTDVTVNSFSTNTNAAAYREGRVDKWYERLPNLDDYDVVVSDNLPEILKVRSDAILSGGFFWHRAVDGIDPKLYRENEKLLSNLEPVMISSELFAPKYLTKLTDLKPVGLFVPDEPKQKSKIGNDLLIACGKSGFYEDNFRKVVYHIINSDDKPPFGTIWVDQCIMPQSTPEWIKKAPFNDNMYGNLKAAICRPGVGTLTDCLWYNVRIFCHFEDGNSEMLRNAKQIEQKGVGMYFDEIINAYNSAVVYLENKEKHIEHWQNNKSINFNGVRETVQLISQGMNS